jgi:hypothetical protein
MVERQKKSCKSLDIISLSLKVNPPPSASKGTKKIQIRFDMSKICPLELKGSLFGLG